MCIHIIMLIAGDGDIDAPITCIPGLETVMCRKDPVEELKSQAPH